MERKGVVTLQGNPLTLLGEEIKVGKKLRGLWYWIQIYKKLVWMHLQER